MPSRPILNVVGVYLPRLSPERAEKLISERLLALRPTTPTRLRDGERMLRDALASVALIEVSVQDADANFAIGDFTQPDRSIDPSNWQVAWNEVFLTADGESRLECPAFATPPIAAYRVTFYVHDWREELGLQSTYGPLACPASSALPPRLWKLAPYESVD